MVPTPDLELPRRVRAARAHADLSVSDLADRVGLGVQTINRVLLARLDGRPDELERVLGDRG